MKAFRPCLAIVAVLAVFNSPVCAKEKGKRPAKAASAESPSEALAPYVNRVDQLLKLKRDVPAKQAALFDQAPGRLATLRAKFVAERESADATSRAKFDAGIETCDALTGALNERQKALGDIRASASVKGSGKLEAGPRKDNLTQGIKGGSGAKAVGTVVERDREKAEARAAKGRAAASDDSLTAMAVNRWNQRAIELRQQITTGYARIK